jgi:hypothetical protein
MPKLFTALCALVLIAGCDRTHHDDYHTDRVYHRTTTVVQPVHTVIHHTTVVPTVQRTVQSVGSRVSEAVSRSRSSSSSSSSRSSSSRRRR